VRLLERSKKRFKTHTNLKDAGGAVTNKDLGTILQLSVGPHFPARQLCQQEDLVVQIRKSSTRWRGFMFPDPGSPILSQYESAIVLDAAKGTSFFEANIWGMLFYSARLGVESQGMAGVNLSAFVGYILFFLRHAAAMLQSLRYLGPVAIEVSLNPLVNVDWLHAWAGYVQSVATSPLDDDLTLLILTNSERLRTESDSVAMEVFRHVFFSVNGPGVVDNPELIRRGYEFNGWP
jgi:hypothetical protein